MTKVLVALIRGYQYFLSPFFGFQCRFTPTCSHYAMACLHKHGAAKGSLYSIKRLLRCHPWCNGGHDPIP